MKGCVLPRRVGGVDDDAAAEVSGVAEGEDALQVREGTRILCVSWLKDRCAARENLGEQKDGLIAAVGEEYA